MRRHVQVAGAIALAAALVVAASGCGGSSKSSSSSSSNGTTTAASPSGNEANPYEGPLNNGTPHRGGTFTMAWDTSFSFTDNFDPTGEYLGDAWGVMTNLIVRTLVSYKHTEGAAGNVPVADLATSLPKPTDGGTTYTFHLKNGIKFGPPVNREITSKDIAYAMERLADKNDGAEYAFYYAGIIKGFPANGNNGIKPISGISTPNAKTIVFHLTKPTGDFLFRMAMPATGPIPPEVGKCFEGKPGDYGRDLVSSGPYMFTGSGSVKLGCPMKPMAGYNGSTRMSFVRNPNYEQSTDQWRKNYPDQFNMVVNGNPSDIVARVQNGSYSASNLQPPPNVLQQYVSDSSRHKQLHVNPGDRTWYLTMNLTQPPFDDIHVRKAMNDIMDKVGLRKAWGGPLAGQIATHILPPTLVANNALANFNPYNNAAGTGDLAKAQAEMKQSKYDPKHTGKCTASACKNVLLIADTIHQYTAMVPVIQADAAKIGITFKVRTIAHAYPTIQTTSNNIPIADRTGWGKDYPDPLTFFDALFTSGAIIPQGNTNYSLVGLTPALNKQKKLGVTGNLNGIPSIDAQYDKCTPLSGSARATCWQNLDKTLMNTVVPWVPYLWQTPDRITTPSLVRWDWDQFTTTTAYSQVAVK